MKFLYLKIFILVFIFGTFLYYGFFKEKELPVYDEIHIHSDILIWINGKKLNLSDDLYQSTEAEARSLFLHFHDNNDEVLHIHAKKQKLYDFFKSLGILLENDCFIDYENNRYCENEENIFELYVKSDEGKWRRVRNKKKFIPSDLDKILIYYGLPDEVDFAKGKITDDACIYSGICPEKGESPPESCSVGDDTSCGSINIKPLYTDNR